MKSFPLSVTSAAFLAIVLLSLFSPLTRGQDLANYLKEYFTGSAIKFGYGSGTSSNNPRIELFVHYCPNGQYYSTGQSCRPNIIAKGYQCHNIQDSGV